jgi:hypothetical protein
LDKIVVLRSTPGAITVENGTEFASKAMDLWAYKNGVHLNFIRPGKPVENVTSKASTAAAGRVSERGDILHPGRRSMEAAPPAAGLQPSPPTLRARRPNPAEFAAISSGAKDGGETVLENAAHLPLSPHDHDWDHSAKKQPLNPVA